MTSAPHHQIHICFLCVWQIKSSVLDMLSFSQLCTSIWEPYHQLPEILCSGCNSLFGPGVGGRQVGFALANNIVHFVESVDCFLITSLYFWNRFFNVGFQPAILVQGISLHDVNVLSSERNKYDFRGPISTIWIFHLYFKLKLKSLSFKNTRMSEFRPRSKSQHCGLHHCRLC